MNCVCGSGQPAEQCCAPILSGTRRAMTPEALMRSRYAAFVLGDFDHILATTDPQTTDQFDHDANRAWMQSSRFTGLTIVNSAQSGNTGSVEFIARFRRDGGPEQQHHERSQFRKAGGRWYFRDGVVVTERNEDREPG